MSTQPVTSAARDVVRGVAPKLIDLSEKVLFGDVWERPGLSKRDRSFITVAALIAMYRDRPASGAPRARADQRRHARGDRRDHHAPRVLRRLARRHDRRDDRPPDLRREEAMKIGFIGLGTMGRHMASNLMKGGHELVVNDVRREAAAPHLKAGATWADTPRAVAEATEVVFTSLPGPVEVEAVALGEQGLAVRARGRQGLLRPLDQLARARAADPRGVQAEGRPHARRAGERRAARRRVGPARPLGRGRRGRSSSAASRCSTRSAIRPYYVGPIGAGSVAKLVHNCAGLRRPDRAGRGLHDGRQGGGRAASRSGRPCARAPAAGAGRSTGSPTSSCPAKFEPPSFALRLAHKDVTLATALGREHKVPMRWPTSRSRR